MTCYTSNTGNQIFEADYNYACRNGTGFHQCCASGDQCGKDGFCHFTHYHDKTVTGYYLGGCTDPTFKDAACPQHCTSFGTQDVIYNATSGLWKCCWGSGSLDCDIPNAESFSAPSAEELFATTSTTSTPSSTTAATSMSTSSTAPSSFSTTFAVSSIISTSVSTPTGTTLPAKNSTSTSPSPSTIALAVVVPVVVLAAMIAGALYWRRKRRTRVIGRVDHADQALPLEKDSEVVVNELSSERPYQREAAELPGRR